MEVTTFPSPSSMTAVERREEAFQLVDDIKVAFALGKRFIDRKGFFPDMRDRLAKYGPNARVSPGQLEGLRKIAARLKGKRK